MKTCRLKHLAGSLAAIVALNLSAQVQPRQPEITFQHIDAPVEPNAIALYAGDAPGSEGAKLAECWDRLTDGQIMVRNVSRPTITPFLPDPAKATGAAVLVVPGGGFIFLSIAHEGWNVAQWLADHGVAAFVLKYRPLETPPSVDGQNMREVFSLAPPNAEAVRLIRPTADAIQALKLIRADAAKWKIDPARVGMIGFSAGAMATLNVVKETAATNGPAFFGYIYGPMTAISVPDKAPPMFAALAFDDPLFGWQGFGIAEAWRKARRPVELHVYEKGNHGYGGLGRPGTTTILMMQQFHLWLETRGVLKP